MLLLAGLYCVLGAVAVTMWLWRTRRRASWRPILVFPVRRHGDRAQPAPCPDHRGDERPAGRQDHVEHLHAAARRAAHPATLLAGPQVSLTLLLTAGFAGSAFTMFTVLPRWDVSVPAAGLGVAVVGLYIEPARTRPGPGGGPEVADRCSRLRHPQDPGDQGLAGQHPGFTCTSPRPAAPGSTWPTASSAAPPSAGSPNSKPASASGSMGTAGARLTSRAAPARTPDRG